MKNTTTVSTRIAALLLVLVMLLGVSACGRPAPAPTAAPVQTPSSPLLPAMEQRRVLEENRALWAFPEGEGYYETWAYTFTDLDRNGQMEVLAASTQGTGVFTYAHFYEVLADGSGVRNLYHAGVEIEGTDDWPEIIVDSLPCYYDRAADRYYYACQGVTRDGAAHQVLSWAALSLKDGVAEWEYLGWEDLQWTDGGEGPIVSCTDAAGNPISEQDYDALVERRFAGLERSEQKLNWTVIQPPLMEFVPEPEPEPTPAPAPAPAPEPAAAPVQSGPQVLVTKNPTSEALGVGGKTWFIAHAKNALALTWEIVDPQGNVYSLADAMSRHPGLSLEALEKDTLAVSNVPQSMNGWGARARFDGQGNTAFSEVATLYVGDYAGAYASVIQAYKTAYETGNRTAEYAFNNNISEYIADSEHVGYGLKDLDKDGMPELVIADYGGDAGKIVFDLYTLYNGLPVQLAMSTARNRWFLRSDSLLYNEASGGAAHSYRSLYRKTGTELSGIRSAFTWPNDAGGVDFYLQEGTVAFEPLSGDTKLSETEFGVKVDEMQGTFFLPTLTKIA